jgi:SAM-dependent methyltransferase
LVDLVARWDRMLERYAPRREQCFDAILCLLEQRVASGRTSCQPWVLDLGCGVGTFGARLLERLPEARYLGVDSDPVMCRLAEVVGAPFEDRFTAAHADLMDIPWWSSPTASIVDLPDLVVVSATLHYLSASSMRRALRAIVAQIRPGGLLAVADRMVSGSSASEDVTRVVGVGGSAPTDHEDDWRSWWATARATPGLADVFERRDAHPPASAEGDGPPHTVTLYRAALEAAGLQGVATIWQWFDDRVVVGVMPSA